VNRFRAFYAWLTGLLVVSFVACASSPAAGPRALSAPPLAAEAPAAPAQGAASKKLPESVEQAEALRAQGVSWTNVEIREHYVRLIGTIRAADERAKGAGEKAEARARRAFQTRHDARLTCRAMMSDRHEVDDLRARDLQKYGQPDGPSFEQLVDHQKKKGLEGDAAYEAIIASSQRTDGAANEMLGVKAAP
jgi:hypothetical protein